MRGAVLAAVCAAAICACAPRRPPGPAAADFTGPAPTGERLIGALEAQRVAVTSARSLARLSYSSPEESHRARQVVLVARPDRLRFEVLSPVGTVFVLTARAGEIAAYARREATVYRGEASPENIGRYASIDLPVTTIVDLLLGTPPLDPGAPASVSVEEGRIRLWQPSGGGASVVWFDAALNAVRYERQDGDGQVVLRASFADVVESEGRRLPARVTLETPLVGRVLEIQLKEPEINPNLADSLFALQTPPGSREVDLDQVAN